MQAGLFYGTIGQTEYIIRKIKEESGLMDAKVIATGGLGKVVYENTKSIEIYDGDHHIKRDCSLYTANRKNREL